MWQCSQNDIPYGNVTLQEPAPENRVRDAVRHCSRLEAATAPDLSEEMLPIPCTARSCSSVVQRALHFGMTWASKESDQHSTLRDGTSVCG